MEAAFADVLDNSKCSKNAKNEIFKIMGIELELSVLLIFQLLGSSVYARFEVETSAWKKVVKWLTMDAITLGLYFFIGHFTLLLPLALLITGLSFHISFCRKNGIDSLKATPRKKYYKLRGWKWEE